MKTKLEELIKELEKEKANAQDVLDNENVHPSCKQQREGYIIAFSFVIQKMEKILNDLPDKRSEIIDFQIWQYPHIVPGYAERIADRYIKEKSIISAKRN
jgi:hypothetical protein